MRPSLLEDLYCHIRHEDFINRHTALTSQHSFTQHSSGTSYPHQLFAAKKFVQDDWTGMQQLKTKLNLVECNTCLKSIPWNYVVPKC